VERTGLADAAASFAAGPIPRGAMLWAVIAALSLAPRMVALTSSSEATMPPDAAHFLNVARCLERGQGFSTMEAWPAWIDPPRLPMPETWKEPAYPCLIAALERIGVEPYAAGRALSFLAGSLLPLVVGALASRLGASRPAAVLAALIVAGSPLMVGLSAAVLSESCFSLCIAVAFLAASWRYRSKPGPTRDAAMDSLAAAAFAVAYLFRSQATLAIPALAWLLVRGRPLRSWLPRLGAATLVALFVLVPWMDRNLKLFGVPFYSDAPLHGAWPYVDTILLSHGLERPASPFSVALAHPWAVVAHTLRSWRVFVFSALPRELFGNPFGMVGLALTPFACRGRWSVWGFAALDALVTIAFFMPLDWTSRYFASTMTGIALLAAAGLAWVGRRLDERSRGSWPGAPALATIVLVTLAAAAPLAWSAYLAAHPATQSSIDSVAARGETSFLRAQLQPDEAVMTDVGSYWTWFLDRPSVHWVVADSVRFDATMRRLKVRWAAIPTSEIPALAAHYPGHRLPSSLIAVRLDQSQHEQLYRVVPAAPATGEAR